MCRWKNLCSRFVGYAGVGVWLFYAVPSALAIRADDDGGGKKAAVAGKRASRAGAESVSPEQASRVQWAERAGIEVTWNREEGVPLSVRGVDLGARGSYSAGRGLAVSGRGRYAEDAVAVMDNLAGLFRISDASQEFIARKTQSDSLGYHHVRLQQQVQDMPVVGGEVLVHFNKEGMAYEVNGRYVPDLEVDVIPSISAAQAETAAKADLQAMKKPVGALAEEPRRVVYSRLNPARLAYELTLIYKDAKAGAGRWRYWIDAADGSILARFNDIQTIPEPTADGQHSELRGSVLVGEGGGETNVTGWYDNVNTHYYLYNTNRKWRVENVASAGYPDAGTYAFRATTNWGTSDRTEVSAARGFDLTQRYFNQVHGLNSFNGLGILARANVHEGDSYVNAYWDGSEFYFGDGDGVEANSLAVLDIAGHEYTHAVTEYSANLTYYGESGALNESFSDVFGTCIEFFGEPDDRGSYPAIHPDMADWLCGEDCWLASTALRDLRNPANPATVGVGNEQPTRYLGSYWYSGTGDNAGVHQNSGVQSFFFYLLCEGGSGHNDGIDYVVTGIGITNAERVAYRALTVYCTADTGYRAARAAWLSAAMDLNPDWASSVGAAWDAVGVQVATVTPGEGASFSGWKGGVFSPATFVFTITNSSSEEMSWGVSHTQTWATVAPENGSIPAFGSQSVTVAVHDAAADLPYGTYTDTLVFTHSASASSDLRVLTLEVFPPVVVEFDLNTDPGWSAEGQWEYGTPLGLDGDPASGATGSKVYGYNLSGAYSNNMPAYALTTLPMDCSDYENIQLSFWRWLGVESAAYDQATLQVSTNGTDWATVWEHLGGTVQDVSWQPVTYSLPAADGQDTVYLRWLMGSTDISRIYSGWNIDDIRLHGTARDDLRVAPDAGWVSEGYVGGPFSPTSMITFVSNRLEATRPLEWSASVDEAWLTVSPTSGVLNGGASEEIAVSINDLAHALTSGVHVATVTFSNTYTGVAVTRSVSLDVYDIPPSPDVPHDPVPSNGAERVPTNVVLRWNPPPTAKGNTDADFGIPPTVYHVYLGTHPDSLLRVASNLTTPSYGPSEAVAFDATLYWRVVASNMSGVATGPVWSFRVAHDMVYFLSSTCVEREGVGSATFTVVRHNGGASDVTVEFGASSGTATAGSDFTEVSGTISFATGQLTHTIVVPILEDGDVEPAETVHLSLSTPSAHVCLASPSNGVLTLLDNDGVSVSLPYDLYDGANNLWDVQGDGSISDGGTDAYDGGHVLLNFSSFTTSVLSSSCELEIGPSTSETVQVTRKIYVPPDRGFCRFLEVLENTGGGVVTQRVRLDTDLGSDSETVVDCTSSGDTRFSPNDDWIVTDDADGSGDPAVAHVIANEYGRQRPTAVNYSAGYVGYEYRVVLNPGQTKSVMHFGAQYPNREMARSHAAGLANLQNGTFEAMSPAEISQVVNFGLATPTPTLWVLPVSQSVDSVAGITSFAVTNTDGGTMAYTASESESWLSISSSGSGTNGGSITVDYQANFALTARTGIVTVVASGANGSPTHVMVVQAGAASSGWDDGYEAIGGGWRRLSWFGDYVPMGGDGWIWHNQHGFFFVPTNGTPQNVWLFASDMGWLYTSDTLYPFIYRASPTAWLWYNGSTNPRWFMNMTAGTWEQRP